jgi:S1-C subfamily serine protease
MSSYEPDYQSARPVRGFPWGCVIVFVFVLIGGGLLAWYFIERGPGRAAGGESAVSAIVVARGSLKSEQERAENVYKKAAPSVVHVTRLGVERNQITLDLEKVPEGTGSGFVWDKDGHIVTNNHVIADVSFGVSVTLPDHSTWTARVVGAFPEKDLAVLHIDAPKDKLHPIVVGSSHDLQVGQSAYAIGNPFGLDQTLTTGVISALDRQIQAEKGQRIQHVIQTSAAINPGNSGGPLLDDDGRLVGITAAILSPSGAWAGVGFAIPVDEVNQVVAQALAKPRVIRPALGVTLAPPKLAEQLGTTGVLILDVLPDSGAAKAGLHPTRRSEEGDIQLGDVILAVAGQDVHSAQDVRAALAQHKVGQTVPVTVERGGQSTTVNVTLQAGQ